MDVIRGNQRSFRPYTFYLPPRRVRGSLKRIDGDRKTFEHVRLTSWGKNRTGEAARPARLCEGQHLGDSEDLRQRSGNIRGDFDETPPDAALGDSAAVARFHFRKQHHAPANRFSTRADGKLHAVPRISPPAQDASRLSRNGSRDHGRFALDGASVHDHGRSEPGEKARAVQESRVMHPYWITAERKAVPSFLNLGVGITAASEDEARAIFLAAFRGEWIVSIRQIATVDELDQGHVVPNMGNMLARGIWFPQGWENSN
ncbi:MAG TPA: hypothetical protein VMD53_18640 [Rhizomicrobium sp.]|nr:hypothetical protein [Rhizomicrobium sp.]